jgi:hypothetical protein
VGPTVVPGAGTPYGITPAPGDYNASTGCYYLDTTGSDNNFGFWTMLDYTVAPGFQTLVEYIPGAAYVVTADLFTTARPAQGYESVWQDFVPTIRLRLSSANETIVQGLNLVSSSGGSLVPSTDPANARPCVFIVDPRDQSITGADLAKLYFSFDLLDFSATNRSYHGEKDEEGLVGLTQVQIETFPVKMWTDPAAARTLVQSYPVGDTFEADASNYLSFATGFGGTPMVAGFDDEGRLLLKSTNVNNGFAYYQMSKTSPQGVDVDPTKWYLYKFYVKMGGYDVDTLRLRLLLGDDQRSVEYNVRQTGDFNSYQLQPESGQAYTVFNVFFAPPADVPVTSLLFAFDMIDFEVDHGDLSAALDKVEAYSFDPPVPPPSP